MAMSGASVATNLNETFDIKVNLFSKVTFNLILSVNQLSETINLIFSKVIHLNIWLDTRLS